MEIAPLPPQLFERVTFPEVSNVFAPTCVKGGTSVIELREFFAELVESPGLGAELCRADTSLAVDMSGPGSFTAHFREDGRRGVSDLVEAEIVMEMSPSVAAELFSPGGEPWSRLATGEIKLSGPVEKIAFAWPLIRYAGRRRLGTA